MNYNNIPETRVPSEQQNPLIQNPDEMYLYQNTPNPLIDSLHLQNDLAFTIAPTQIQEYLPVDFNSQNDTQAAQISSPLEMVSPQVNYVPFGVNQLPTDATLPDQTSMGYFETSPSVPSNENATTDGIPSPNYNNLDNVSSTIDNVGPVVPSELPTPSTSSASSINHLQILPASNGSDIVIKLEKDATESLQHAHGNPPPPTPPSTTATSTGKKKRAARRRLTVVQKIAHNKIEKRYRTNINEKIFGLQTLIDPSWSPESNQRPILPTLAATESNEENEESSGSSTEESNPQYNKKKGKQKSVTSEPTPSLQSSSSTKLNKSSILERAAEYIVHLKELNAKLKCQNKDLPKKLDGFD
jgi:twist-like factor